MNKQDIFDTVATHLFTQNQRSTSNIDFGGLLTAASMYRAPGGLKCAVGCLIPDEDYTDSMECTTVADLLYSADSAGWKLPEYFKAEQELLGQLQICHDFSSNWESTAVMQSTLRMIAERFAIATTVLDTLSFSDR